MKRAIQTASEGAKKIKLFSGENKEMIKSLAGLSDEKLLTEFKKINLNEINLEQSNCNIYVPFTKKNLPMKERVGRGFYYWCKNHQNEAFGGICPKKEQLPLNHGILKLETLKDTAIWLAVDESEQVVLGYHVHQGKGKKTIDDNYPSLMIDGVEILGGAGIAYRKAVKSGLPMGYVECSNCRYAHNDEDWFAENTHGKHLCKGCGKNFNNKNIGNPWVKFVTNHVIETTDLKAPFERLVECEKVEKWNAQERHALLWTYTHKNEKSGFHIHGWRTVEGTLRRVVDDTYNLSEEEEKQLDTLIAKLEKEKKNQQEPAAKIEQPLFPIFSKSKK